MKRKTRRMSRVRVIVLSFICVILAGTLLLLLPFATRTGETTGVLDALFTSVSATCVTGLVVADTWSHWTLFGQLVILTMIQIGGLGFITIATLFFIMTKKQMNLSARSVLQDSISASQGGGVFRLARMILAGTALIEGSGALLLAVRFVPKFGWGRGLFYSVFHSISAFCNAGFDLMGGYTGPYSSFSGFYGDGYVISVLSALILIGGIGFLVWNDVVVYRLQFKRYSLQSKLVLIVSVILLVIPTICFFFTERSGLMQEYSFSERIWAAFFSAVAPRTAGFNSIDTAGLSGAGYLMTLVLMFIGGGPGSTAGGIKMTTIAVLLLSCLANMGQKEDIDVYDRRISHYTVMKAANVFMVNLSLALIVAGLICLFQELPLRDILFETISAISTVGMSTGITRELGTASRLLLALLMFCGRVGSLSFALALTSNRRVAPVRYPSENITVG